MGVFSMYTKRKRPPVKDWLMSQKILDDAVKAILKRVRINRSYDIPYTAGYSCDGKTIYIDRHLPKKMVVKGRSINTDKFIILHEAVEKALIAYLNLHYQYAHQIALRTEQNAVRAAGIEWRTYDRFMQTYIKEIGDERLSRIPADLDIQPYQDEHDKKLLTKMKKLMHKKQGVVA